MLFQKLVQLLLFIWGQGVNLARGGFCPRNEFNTMIPTGVFWEGVERAFSKNTLEIMKVLRDQFRNGLRDVILLMPSLCQSCRNGGVCPDVLLRT
jgi:hypothetical protein